MKIIALAAQPGIFGNITPPYTGQNAYSGEAFGLIDFLGNILRLAFLIGGFLVLIKIFLAGFAYITAGGEPKKLEQAWANIWQSIVGMLIMVSAFVLTAIVGKILFGDPLFILNPFLYGVGK